MAKRDNFDPNEILDDVTAVTEDEFDILGDLPDLPQTRAMLMQACDTRLPARLQLPELDLIAEALIAAAQEVMGNLRAYGT